MNKILFFGISLLLALSAGVISCSSTDDEEKEWNENDLEPSPSTDKEDTKIVIEYFERNGLKLRVVDITEQFSSAKYYGTVPVKHVQVENLPAALIPVVKQWGRAGLTKVFRMEYQGKTFYDINSTFSSALFNIYDSEGERLKGEDLYNMANGSSPFTGNVTDACCILVLDAEIVKIAENAPNYLIGTWENEWRPTGSSYLVIHPNLPFEIWEVLTFREDGTGYLRTIKQTIDYTVGHDVKEITLDPFIYELIDYHGGKQYGYDGYFYKCSFEAGDVVEYLARSYNNMHTLRDGSREWLKQTADFFESYPVNAGQKWGVPAQDANSPIVGRWKTTVSNGTLVDMPEGEYTWVFRSDNTGYRLLNKQFNGSFAYNVSYNGSEAELFIWPDEYTTKATIQGSTLKMEGWPTMQRVNGGMVCYAAERKL